MGQEFSWPDTPTTRCSRMSHNLVGQVVPLVGFSRLGKERAISVLLLKSTNEVESGGSLW
jgi:hypothetical protein